MKYCQIFTFAALVGFGVQGCSLGTYSANVTGLIVKATSPEAVTAEFSVVDFTGTKLTEKLKLHESDVLTITGIEQVLRLEGTWVTKDATETYQVLVGGLSDSMPGKVGLDLEYRKMPSIVVPSGWMMVWGFRPHGNYRFMRAGIAASYPASARTSVIFRNDTSSSTVEVFLVEGDPIKLECISALTGEVFTRTLSTTGKFVQVNDACDFTEKAMTTTELGSLSDFTRAVNRFSLAAGGPTVPY